MIGRDFASMSVLQSVCRLCVLDMGPVSDSALGQTSRIGVHSYKVWHEGDWWVIGRGLIKGELNEFAAQFDSRVVWWTTTPNRALVTVFEVARLNSFSKRGWWVLPKYSANKRNQRPTCQQRIPCSLIQEVMWLNEPFLEEHDAHGRINYHIYPLARGLPLWGFNGVLPGGGEKTAPFPANKCFIDDLEILTL